MSSPCETCPLMALCGRTMADALAYVQDFSDRLNDDDLGGAARIAVMAPVEVHDRRAGEAVVGCIQAKMLGNCTMAGVEYSV